MILIREEIEARRIVEPGEAASRRPTTYDATVGDIMIDGKSLPDAAFDLPPRGIVWVVSAEEFRLPGDITGLATLRTSWTHKGILALNLGVIDPGWSSHLATAVVNFSNRNVEIKKGDTFFRVLFLTHKETAAQPTVRSGQEYRSGIQNNTRLFSSTFLSMDSLVSEVAERVFGMPRWGVWIGLVAIGATFLAIVLPLFFTAVTQGYAIPGRIDLMNSRIDFLEKRLSETPSNSGGAEPARSQR